MKRENIAHIAIIILTYCTASLLMLIADVPDRLFVDKMLLTIALIAIAIELLKGIS